MQQKKLFDEADEADDSARAREGSKASVDEQRARGGPAKAADFDDREGDGEAASERGGDVEGDDDDEAPGAQGADLQRDSSGGERDSGEWRADDEGDAEEREAPSDTTRDARAAKRAEVAEPTAKRAPKVPPPRQSMITGAVLGAAIGDAMGHPTEFISSMAAIRSRFGPKGVTRFELYWERGGKRFAPYTDDTQMAEVVLRTLVESRADDAGLDATMKRMAEGFIEWAARPQGGHRAPGNACLAGCRALAAGARWSEAGGVKAGGCGSVMRAYPFGLIFADDIRRAERWSVAHSKLTHRDPIALAACAAMAVGMARIVAGDPVLTVASEMVAAACRYSAPTAAMMAEAIDDAVSGVAPRVTLDRLRAWAAHEAIAAAAYIFVRHPDDVSAAILEGANTPGDSDSIATLAGAMVGARCGVEAIPGAWVRDVERSDELLELAVRVSNESNG